MVVDLQGSIIHIHGPPKVGKTTLASSFPAPVRFIATEPGHRYLPEIQKKLLVHLPPEKDGWQEFKQLKFLHPKVQTYVIDVISNLYLMCLEWTSKKEGLTHPSDGAHGKGWNAVRREFCSVMAKLTHATSTSNATLITIDHTNTTDIVTSVETYSKMISGMAGQARSMWLPVPDHVWYYSYDSLDSLEHTSDTRMLWTGGNSNVEAGTRDKKVTVRQIRKVPSVEQYSFICDSLDKKTN